MSRPPITVDHEQRLARLADQLDQLTSRYASFEQRLAARRVVAGGGLSGGGALLLEDVTLSIQPGLYVPAARRIVAGSGLSGGGQLTQDVTLSLALPAMGSASTYNYPASITTDAYGRITAVTVHAPPERITASGAQQLDLTKRLSLVSPTAAPQEYRVADGSYQGQQKQVMIPRSYTLGGNSANVVPNGTNDGDGFDLISLTAAGSAVTLEWDVASQKWMIVALMGSATVV